MFLSYQYPEDAVGCKHVKKASAKIRKSTYSLGWDGPNKNQVSNYLLVTETDARQKAAMERGLRLLPVSSMKEDR